MKKLISHFNTSAQSQLILTHAASAQIPFRPIAALPEDFGDVEIFSSCFQAAPVTK